MGRDGGQAGQRARRAETEDDRPIFRLEAYRPCPAARGAVQDGGARLPRPRRTGRASPPRARPRLPPARPTGSFGGRLSHARAVAGVAVRRWTLGAPPGPSGTSTTIAADGAVGLSLQDRRRLDRLCEYRFSAVRAIVADIHFHEFASKHPEKMTATASFHLDNAHPEMPNLASFSVARPASMFLASAAVACETV